MQVFDVQSVEPQSEIYLVKKLPEVQDILFEGAISLVPQKYPAPWNSSTVL